MTEEEAALLTSGSPTGQFCCPICYVWYDTRMEKADCLTAHGYETIEGVQKETLQ
jgi:hypothetical protein